MVSVVNVQPGSPASIEPATWRDLNALRNLEKVCFPKDSWPLWDLIGVLTLPNVVRLKAVADGGLVGFAAGDVRPSQRLAWVATIGVLPEYRGRGIATALLQEVEKRVGMPEIRLNVRASNQAAIRVYLENGYQRAGLWEGYYQDGENAVIMEKRLY